MLSGRQGPAWSESIDAIDAVFSSGALLLTEDALEVRDLCLHYVTMSGCPREASLLPTQLTMYM